MIKRETTDPGHTGGLLCDEMGLGKTMEVLGLMKNSPSKQNLLLCPKAVIQQWCAAARRSRFNVQEVNVKGGWSTPQPFFSGQPFLCVTNYEKAVSRPALLKRNWNRLILDEAHKIRNPASFSYQAVKSVRRDATWAVTATPLVNSEKDVYALANLVGYKKNDNLDINLLFANIALHRSMESMRSILPELPAAAKIHDTVLDFDTEEEAEFYQGIQGKLVKKWKSLESDKSLQVLALIMKLRQLSVHPAVYVNARKKSPMGYAREYTGGSTKFSALLSRIEAEKGTKRWIVFCQFRDEMDMLQEFLEASPAVYRAQQYHGGVSDSEKEKVLASTQQEVDGHDVLLLQLQSGGVGLNLQHFTKIVFMSPWWTAALMDQAVGRAVRIGQKETVEVIRLVLKEEETLNIDRMMMSKAESKRGELEVLFSHASNGTGVPPELPSKVVKAVPAGHVRIHARIKEIEATLSRLASARMEPNAEVEVIEDPQN